MLHGPVQIAGVGNLAVSPNTWWSWAIACIAGTLLAASPPFMRSSARPGIGLTRSGPAVIIVDDDALLGGEGSTWDTAFRFLQDALAIAARGDEIRVAQGTYNPDQDEAGNVMLGDRRATFRLINGVALMGGYAGIGHPDPDDRDINLYLTTLSGDLLGNDGPDFEGYDENSYHVVTTNAVDRTTALDGLTVTAGNADGAQAPDDRGAGIYNDQGNPTLAMCTIVGNWAKRGAGMYNIGANPTLTDCCFCTNTANLWGGGIYNENHSSPSLTGCSFENNRATNQSGGGIFNLDTSSPSLMDCTFVGNFAGFGGGMASSAASTATVQGCVFADNTSGAGVSSGSAIAGGSLTITGCTFLRNGGTAVRSGNLTTITDCTFNDNQNGVRNQSGNVVIADCVFSGTPSVSVDNRGGDVLLTNCTFTGAGAAIFSLFAAETVMVDCTIDGVQTGVYIDRGSASLVDCTIRDVDEGVVIFHGQGRTLSLTNCRLENGIRGIVDVSSSRSMSTLVNCWFTGMIEVFHVIYRSPAILVKNCTLANNGAVLTGVIAGPSLTLANCILWESPLAPDAGTVNVLYSDVQGGWPGPGNIDADPLFVDALNGDFRLSPGSPCIDAGNNWGVASDFADLDADGDTSELTPFDLDGNPRFVHAAANSHPGCGVPAVVDMGAYEFPDGNAVGIKLGDIDGDGTVGMFDLVSLLINWGPADGGCQLADFDLDGNVAVPDLLTLLANWTG